MARHTLEAKEAAWMRGPSMYRFFSQLLLILLILLVGVISGLFFLPSHLCYTRSAFPDFFKLFLPGCFGGLRCKRGKDHWFEAIVGHRVLAYYQTMRQSASYRYLVMTHQ